MATSVNCCELLNGNQAFIKSAFAFDHETNGDAIISGASTRYGVGSETLLTVVELSDESGEFSVLFEMEFEAKIVALAWDQSEECLVVGDSNGTLHLVTSGGSLLFSKKLHLSDNVKFLSLQFISLKETDDLQTMLAIISDGTILGISNMPVGTIVSLAATEPKALGPVLQGLQFIKCALPLTEGVSLIKSHVFVDRSSDAWESDMCRVLSVTSVGDVAVADLGQLGSLTSPESFLTTSESTVPTKNCVDFYVQPVASRCNIVYLLYGDGLLAVTDSGLQAVLSTMPLDIASPSMALVQQIDSKSIASTSHDYFHGVILVAERGDADQRTACKTQLVGSTIALACAGGATVSLLDLGVRTLRTAEGDAKPELRLVASGGCGSGCALMVDSGDSKSSVVRLIEPVGALVQGLSHDCELPDCTGASLIGRIARAILSGAEESAAGLHSEFLDRLVVLNASGGVTCGEVTAVAHLLVHLPCPPSGFIDKLLTSAETAVENNKTARHTDPGKQRCIAQLLKLAHVRETASAILAVGDEGEERLRLTIVSLLPQSLPTTIVGLLRGGAVQHAILCVQRHLSGSALPVCAVEALDSVPLSASVADISALVRGVLLPALDRSSVSRSEELLALAESLCSRARAVEATGSRPLDALTLVQLAVDITSSLPQLEGATVKLAALKTLHSDLRLQQVIWRQWDEAVALSDVSALGLEALLFDRLDSVSEEALAEEARSSMRAVAAAMGQDMDGILHRWIEHTVAHRIIRSGVTGTDADDDGDEVDEEEQHFRDNTREAAQQYAAGETCTVSRLVTVLSLIGDRNIVAKLALVLFQIPSVENSSLKLSLAAAAGVAESANVTQQLCKIATSVCDYVDSATREALVAAMRLLKVKALAASYGIRKFDPRDSKQVRAAVAIISSSFHRGVDGSCVGDAISFAADWGFSNVELNALVVRALALRICSGGGGCEESVRQILSAAVESAVHGGSLQVVAEEAVSYCLDALQEACEGITFDPSVSSSDKSSESKTTAAQVVRGALWVCSYFLDSLREKSHSAVPTAQPSVAIGDREASSLLLSSSSRKSKASEDSGSTSFLTAALHSSIKRLQSLQTGHDLYLGLASLRDDRVCKAAVLKMAKARVAEVIRTAGSATAADVLPLNAHCRRLCVLLGVSPVFFSHTAMKLLVEANHMPLAMEVARSLSSEKAKATGGEQGASQLDGAEAALFDSAEDSALLLDAAMTLCGIAAKKASQSNYDEYSAYPIMSLGPNQDDLVPEHLSFPVRAFELSRDVLRASVSHCQPAYIGRTLDLLCGSELVLSVYERVEGATNLSATSGHFGSSAVSVVAADASPQLMQLSDGAFSRDGILMQPSAVVKPLMRYALAEVRRRSAHATAVAGGKAADLKKSEGGADLEELVGVLQRSENHLLATRTLFSSWVAGGAKSQLLKSSLMALSRKILVYRDIDKPFAVACLAALPYEAMVRELKTSVPSIQSDFGRLRTVALVGEELSQLWDNADLLTIFQVMQTNARWWHVLSSLGIKLDMRTFQSTDTARRDAMIRSLVPELLTRSGMDLELALEYCQQYHLEPACALLAYIEMLLRTPPQSTADISWAGKVRRAAGRVEDKLVLKCLRDSLLGVSAVDYERIRYVCAWLVDMLSLEESAGGGRGADDDDDDTGDGLNRSVAVDNTAQRLKLATLTSVAEEIDTYRKYSDIAAYLAGIHFPAEAVAQIVGAGDTYRGVSGIYRERVPLWQLLDGPWTVIEPLLSAVPEVAMKLSPLCTALQLDKNDFGARRIKALYASMTSSVKCAANESSGVLSGPSPFSRETKRLSLQVAAESIAATVTDPLQQVAVYRWLYARERGSDDAIAKLALESALAIATPLVNRNSTYSALHAELRSDLLTLSCECIVKQFNQQCLAESSAVAQTLLSRLSDPPALLKLLLELSLEVAWDLQLQSLAALTGDGVVLLPSCYDVTLRAPAHSVSSFLALASAAVDDLARQCGLDQPVIVSNGPASAQQKPSVLESIRFDIVGRMLNDIDGNGVSDKDPSAASAAAVSMMSKGFWGVGGHSASVLSASEAETRRREDVFLSFAIAAAISTCTDASVKRMYIAQQDSLMRGKSSSTQRRLTCRSRFRAAQALSFLRLASAGRERDSQIATVYDAADLDPFRRFLYCLAEMKEIRLSCTEESLLAAMGLALRDFALCPATEGASGAVLKADPRSLIRTWLHDEGAHVEVVELARDLQLVANAGDEASWYLLLTHMLSKDQHRALLQTVAALQHMPIFRDLCFGLVGADVLQCVAKVLAEAVEKAEQVLQLADIRSSSPEGGDWLHCALTATLDSKERPPKGSSESAARKDGNTASAAAAAAGKKHRVFLQPRLAYGAGTWDEQAPEDVLSTLSSATRICGALTSVLSSRLLPRHNSLSAIRASAVRMLGLTQAFAVTDKAGQRDVRGGTLEALARSGLSLLSPAYLIKDGTLAAASTTYIADAMNAACVWSGEPSERDSEPSLLWRVFAASSQRFHTDVVSKALDALVASQDAVSRLLSDCVSTPRDEDAAQLLAWCFERLSVPTARTVIVDSIKSQSATAKQTLVKRIRSLEARIQEITGTTLPPLESLMQ